jgi:hypothetical protein
MSAAAIRLSIAAKFTSDSSPAAPPMTNSATSLNKPSTRCEMSGEPAKRHDAPPHHAVYDCVIFAQALINPHGPAAECVDQARRVRLYVSPYVLHEIREFPSKIPPKHGVNTRPPNSRTQPRQSLAGEGAG